MTGKNPYDWNSANPKIHLPRSQQVAETTKELLKGRVVVVIGGRGMGKSVFLRDVEAALSESPGVRIVPMKPPVEMTAAACRSQLTSALGTATGSELEAELVEYFNGRDGEQLVLVYDELEGYALDATSSTSPNLFFNRLEAARKSLDGRLCVLAAGSVNVIRLAHEIGSVLLSRAMAIYLPAFDTGELRQLARPLFMESGTEDDEETTIELLATLRALTGGSPALAAYGLEQLWERGEVSPAALLAAYLDFGQTHGWFVKGFARSLGLGTDFPGPANIWRHMLSAPGPYTREALRRAAGPDSAVNGLVLDECLGVLQGSGVARFSGPMNADPLHAEAVPSILTNVFEGLLGEAAPDSESAPARLRADLVRVVRYMRRFAADFFHGPKEKRDIVPEATMCAVLAISMQQAGWSTSREALQGPGRTDLLLTHPAHPDCHAVVEVKIWPRNVGSVHEQVSSYALEGTAALAVVTFGGGVKDDWTRAYPSRCFGGDHRPETEGDVIVYSAPADRGRFIDHVLLHLPKR